MFAFAIIVVVAASIIGLAVSGLANPSADMRPESVGGPKPTTPPVNNENAIQWNKKDKKAKEDKTLIGLVTPSLVISKSAYPVTYSFDSTKYKDKCVLKITNSTGVNNVEVYDFSIRGIPVYRYAGNNGYRFEHKNKSDIEANGEIEYKVSNNYITSSGQCEIVGDYVRKELEPHDMYTVTLHGVHPYFQIGDRYELNVDYQHPSMPFPTELISIDVEIRGVSISRGHDNIGSTILTCRVPSDAWSKTTSTKAKWISSGLPFDKLNRANVLTIGAYDYPGQADVYCDGIDDDVQIQEAIDNLSSAGGGVVQLSRGKFYISATLDIKTSVTFRGEGEGTELLPSSNSVYRIINCYTDIGKRTICDFTINGDSDNVIYTTYGGAPNIQIIIDANTDKRMDCFNVQIKNYRFEATNQNIVISMFNNINNMRGCSVVDITSVDDTVSGLLSMYGFIACKYIATCSVNGIATTGSLKTFGGFNNCEFVSSSGVLSCSSSYGGESFSGCKNITVCSSLGNTGFSGFSACRSVQQCKSDDSTKYYLSYADSGTSNACSDSSAGGYNS